MFRDGLYAVILARETATGFFHSLLQNILGDRLPSHLVEKSWNMRTVVADRGGNLVQRQIAVQISLNVIFDPLQCLMSRVLFCIYRQWENGIGDRVKIVKNLSPIIKLINMIQAKQSSAKSQRFSRSCCKMYSIKTFESSWYRWIAPSLCILACLLQKSLASAKAFLYELDLWHLNRIEGLRPNLEA